MKMLSLSSVVALLLASLAGSTARADFDFTFASNPIITAASANPPGTFNTINNGINNIGLPASTFLSVTASGTSSISLIGRNPSATLHASGGLDTQFLDVFVTSSDTVTRQFSANFDVNYGLADPTPTSGPAGPQTTHFLGKLTGSIGGGTTTVAFSAADFNPAVGAGQNILAGDGLFNVILLSYSDPQFGGGLPGHLTARVIPEPTTAALLAIGAIGLAIGWRRRAIV
jgi:PEP-CTERM motif